MRLVPLTAALFVLAAAPLEAQRDAALALLLPGNPEWGREAPAVRTGRVLADRNLHELLQNGFPARLHYRLELWSAGGLFDNLVSQTDWDVIVTYQPLERRYTATRIEGERATPLGSADRLEPIEAALSRPFRPTFRPPNRRDRYYYVATLDVEMLSVNDLDEVQRWLRGELSPAVRGQRNPGTAITRGAKTLVIRLLGGKERHYEARSRIFRP